MSLDSILRATGKNLFDTVNAVKLNGGSDFSVTNNIITVSQNIDGSYRSANVSISNSLAGKTITLSAKSNTSGVNIAGLRIQWVSDTGMAAGDMILGRPDSAGNIVVTGTVPAQPDETHNNLCLMFYSNTSGTLETGTTYTATYSDIQLEEGSTATTYEPYHLGPKKVTIPSDSKNLIVYPYRETSKVEEGITWTVGFDGRVTAEGTSTEGTASLLYIRSDYDRIILEQNKQYTLSGYYAGSGATLELRGAGEGASQQHIILDTQHQTKTFTAADTEYRVFCSVNNTTASAVFYPQLEEGISATEYSLNAGDREVKKISYGSRNLFPISTAGTQTITGITFTNNSDGSFTVNGTATANSTYRIGSIPVDTSKTYTLSGCPGVGSYTTYGVYYYDTVTSQYDFGEGVSFKPKGNTLSIYIRVFSGAIIENLVFKPQVEFGNKKTEYVPYSKEVVWQSN